MKYQKEMKQVDYLDNCEGLRDLFYTILDSCSEECERSKGDETYSHENFQSVDQSFKIEEQKEDIIVDQGKKDIEAPIILSKEKRSQKNKDKKRPIKKQDKKKEPSRKNQEQKKRQQYFTKNFLPAFKKSHLKFLKSRMPFIMKVDERVNQIVTKNGINMGDYVYLYNIEGMEQHWNTYFTQNIIYRDFMIESRVSPSNKIVFQKYIYRFSAANASRKFDHIAEN